ncbi:MBL fold metallo-hydrolase [Erythrobacter sp. JK5]|uniref:MBL fold metallo-hydrolase n=1 Tax=Erythrobacter sp. JK5 TaxID=2829500 RepID=UPI001BAA23E1|nr:MBL fold metallo-hydrolase [Erythrobacter sp. JK5]QUL37878.1 MBL fold metallo-hydrolase [Erythrobacter sp. JK5]
MIRVMIAAAAVMATPAAGQEPCQRELVVLGAGQDAGAPQIGNADDDGPRLMPSSLGVIDRENGQRFLFDATPAITEQLALLDRLEPPARGLGIDGIFLTHAHFGHYLGLAWLGREAANTQGAPVFAMPRMAQFLRSNGPWNQLVELGNIALTEMDAESFTVISDDFGVLPIVVPHRDEYSETVGFLIMTPDKRALYLPDIDHWEGLEEATNQSLADFLAAFDYAFIDATFWDDNELPGRDMSEIPHPRVKATMDRLQDLPASERAKVHFIHMNHTNPIRDPSSTESREVETRGFNVARRGDRVCLSEQREP